MITCFLLPLHRVSPDTWGDTSLIWVISLLVSLKSQLSPAKVFIIYYYFYYSSFVQEIKSLADFLLLLFSLLTGTGDKCSLCQFSYEPIIIIIIIITVLGFCWASSGTHSGAPALVLPPPLQLRKVSLSCSLLVSFGTSLRVYHRIREHNTSGEWSWALWRNNCL